MDGHDNYNDLLTTSRSRFKNSESIVQLDGTNDQDFHPTNPIHTLPPKQNLNHAVKFSDNAQHSPLIGTKGQGVMGHSTHSDTNVTLLEEDDSIFDKVYGGKPE